jgi:hypothetical protein
MRATAPDGIGSFLEQALSLDEYRGLKNKGVEEKAALKARLIELR